MFGTGEKADRVGPGSTPTSITAWLPEQQRIAQNNMRSAGMGMKPPQNNKMDAFNGLELETAASVNSNSNIIARSSVPKTKLSPHIIESNSSSQSDPFRELDRILSVPCEALNKQLEVRRNTSSGVPPSQTPTRQKIGRSLTCGEDDLFHGLGLTPRSTFVS